MQKYKKIIGLIIGIFSLILGISFLTVYKIKRPFKPLVLNYQAYMKPELRNNFEKDFTYHEFGDLSEFQKLLQDNRVIGGVSSDFAIAKDAKKGLIKKVNYAYLFKNNQELSNKFKSKDLKIRREAFKTIAREQTLEHLDKYNQFLYKEIDGKKVYDLDGDGVEDQLWEYTIPYYIQDKVIVYTVGDYDENGEKKPLKSNIASWDNKTKEDIRENGINFDDQSFLGIFKTLRSYGYQNFGWTEAMRDNLLLGSEKISLDKKNFDFYSGKVESDNQSDFSYKKQINSFTTIVKEATGEALNNTKHNVFIPNGLELLATVIDNKKPTSVVYLYNGDAIDAFYSKDNFSTVEDGQAIKIVRPKNNLTLLDGWVFSKNITNEHEEKLLDKLYENIYYLEDRSIDEMLLESLEKVEYSEIQDEEGNWIKISGEGYTINFELLNSLANFDYVNYTPSLKNSYFLIEKLYFNDAVKTARISENDEEVYLLIDKRLDVDEKNDNSKVNIDFNVLKNIENITLDDIKTEAEENSTKLALNIYKSQQKYQTKNGFSVDEDTDENNIYEVNYAFLQPVNDSLESEIQTYYNLKVKG
ncbi:type 2 periplasmic-binding domain-containing protein [Mesomycoplasma neurolyticum]|uniref:Uncharacterized protein n=1 Tax=Mesomycoplasma neurolyticum TaxID=2120 RepID=A0A449A5B8_9BACT|nr:hypothetical protein [Mesomycoplasma neurolyticum]VEU59422.1 Uncharacterised protein [Mesomycoplasma neurolyticum]